MSEPIDFSSTSVLVIDDSDHTRNLIRNMLHQIGIRSIGEATNGKDGVMEILRTRPGIVLCDIHMKPMDGLQVVKQVRAARIPEIAATPIIMLTADNNAMTVAAAKSADVDGYLVKPPFLQGLKTCLERVVAQGRRKQAEGTETPAPSAPPAQPQPETIALTCPVCGATAWAPPGTRLACLATDRHPDGQPKVMAAKA